MRAIYRNASLWGVDAAEEAANRAMVMKSLGVASQGGTARLTPAAIAAATAAVSAASKGVQMAQPSFLVRGNAFGDEVVTVTTNPANPTGGVAGSCDPCSAGACPIPLDRLPNGSGDIPTPNEELIVLRPWNTACASNIVTQQQSMYRMTRASFASAFQIAKARSVSNILTFRAVVTTPGPVQIALNSPNGVGALGIMFRVSLPENGANGPYSTRWTASLLDGGVYDTQVQEWQNANAPAPGVVYMFAFRNINEGTYFYSGVNVPVIPSLDNLITFDGLPVGSQINVQTIPSDSPNGRAIFG